MSRRTRRVSGKKIIKYWYKTFYSKTTWSFKYKINCISKSSIKIFTKRKKNQNRKDLCLPNTSEFKTSVTYNFFLTLCQTTVSVVKQLSLDITRVFTGHSQISEATIQAWSNNTILPTNSIGYYEEWKKQWALIDLMMLLLSPNVLTYQK